MRSPHEETWFAWHAGTTGASHELHHGPFQGSCLAWGHDEDDWATVRLAAQAPAMARLLLAVEWSGMRWDPSGGVVCCPSCTAARGRDAVHAADCELVAVLRAAGVLP